MGQPLPTHWLDAGSFPLISTNQMPDRPTPGPSPSPMMPLPPAEDIADCRQQRRVRHFAPAPWVVICQPMVVNGVWSRHCRSEPRLPSLACSNQFPRRTFRGHNPLARYNSSHRRDSTRGCSHWSCPKDSTARRRPHTPRRCRRDNRTACYRVQDMCGPRSHLCGGDSTRCRWDRPRRRRPPDSRNPSPRDNSCPRAARHYRSTWDSDWNSIRRHRTSAHRGTCIPHPGRSGLRNRPGRPHPRCRTVPGSSRHGTSRHHSIRNRSCRCKCRRRPGRFARWRTRSRKRHS